MGDVVGPQTKWSLYQESKSVAGSGLRRLPAPGGMIPEAYDVEAMCAAQIAKLEADTREVVWMVDVVLPQITRYSKKRTVPTPLPEYDASRTAYTRWFKTNDYLPSVVFILRQVREFALAFLHRRRPNLGFDERRTKPNLGFNFVSMASRCGGMIAITDWNLGTEDQDLERARISFCPYFWQSMPYSLVGFHTFRLLPPETSLELPAYKPSASTVLHEFIHLVSSLCFDKFLAASRLKKADLPEAMQRPYYYHNITDTRLYDAAGNNPPETLLRAVPREWDKAYDSKRCLILAELELGAPGELLNADSYRLFVAQTTFEYLGGYYETFYATDVMVRKAAQELADLLNESRPGKGSKWLRRLRKGKASPAIASLESTAW